MVYLRLLGPFMGNSLLCSICNGHRMGDASSSAFSAARIGCVQENR